MEDSPRPHPAGTSGKEERRALDRLMQELYLELRRLAHAYLRARPASITLQTSGEFELDANIDLEITIEDHSLTYFETAIYGTTYLDLAADVRATTAATFATEGDGVPLLQEPIRKSAWGVIGLPRPKRDGR